MNERVNMPGGVDKIGHSSVQPWSAGALFPAVIYRVEYHFAPLDIAHLAPEAYEMQSWHEILLDGEKFSISEVEGDDFGPAFLLIENPQEPDYRIFRLPAGSYADAYDAAAAFALGLLMAKDAEKNFDGSLLEVEVEGDEVPADYWMEVKASAVELQHPKGWDMVEAGLEEDAPRALLADCVADPEPVADHWLDKRPARDLGWSA
jgi:hypothetical protein